MIPPWVYAYLYVALSSVGSLLEAVKNAFIAFWNSLVAFFTEQMNAAGWILTSVGDLAGQTLALMQALYYLGWWTAYTIVPRWGSQLLSEVEAWAGAELRALSDAFNAVVTDVRNWVTGLIHGLASDLSALRSDATRWLADVWNTLTWTYNLVSLLLTDPGVLAQWVFVSLLQYGMSYVEDNAALLGRWFLGKAVSWAVRGASFLEDVIVSII